MERAVEVKNLVKVYGRNVRALDGVNLSVEAGKTFALLGPNGAGKTTLVRILTTQIRPTSGEAFVFGLDVAREGGKVRKIIGYVPQEMSVWTDLSGYEKGFGFGFGPGFGMRGFGRGFGRGMRGFGPCWQAPATNGQ